MDTCDDDVHCFVYVLYEERNEVDRRKYRVVLKCESFDSYELKMRRKDAQSICFPIYACSRRLSDVTNHFWMSWKNKDLQNN